MLSSKNRKTQRHYKSALYPKIRVALDRVNYVRDLTDRKEIIPTLDVVIMLLGDIIQLYRPRNIGGLPRLSEAVRVEVIRLVKQRTPLKIVAFKCRISVASVNNIIREEKIWNYPRKKANHSGGLPNYPPTY